MNNTERTTTEHKSTASRSSAIREDKQASVSKQEIAVPVIEEELQVGKREVSRGGVRVSSRLVETPIEEDVMLRKEHVRVQRKPVDRPIETTQDLKAFEGSTVELVEVDEEAVVAKKARIIEEVVVSKEVTQRTDTIHETLHHTEVQVESLQGTERSGAIAQFEDYDSDFRQHYATADYSQQGYAYEHVAPAYRYGYQLGMSEDFKGRDWPAVEQKAAAAWEERNPGTWEQVKNAARHAWDKATGRI